MLGSMARLPPPPDESCASCALLVGAPPVLVRGGVRERGFNRFGSMLGSVEDMVSNAALCYRFNCCRVRGKIT